jgi:hypothetical protein
MLGLSFYDTYTGLVLVDLVEVPAEEEYTYHKNTLSPPCMIGPPASYCNPPTSGDSNMAGAAAAAAAAATAFSVGTLGPYWHPDA